MWVVLRHCSGDVAPPEGGWVALSELQLLDADRVVEVDWRVRGKKNPVPVPMISVCCVVNLRLGAVEERKDRCLMSRSDWPMH